MDARKKYNVTIADMELRIITDEDSETVSRIVGIIDRRIREIQLKSPRCSKNEAAILCALDYCGEKMTYQEQNVVLEKEVTEATSNVHSLQKEVAKLKETLATVKHENSLMRTLLSNAGVRDPKLTEPAPAKRAAGPALDNLSIFDEEEPEKPAAKVKDTVESSIPDTQEPEPESEPAPQTPEPSENADEDDSRLGSMFRSLFFEQ